MVSLEDLSDETVKLLVRTRLPGPSSESGRVLCFARHAAQHCTEASPFSDGESNKQTPSHESVTARRTTPTLEALSCIEECAGGWENVDRTDQGQLKSSFKSKLMYRGPRKDPSGLA